MPEKRNVIPELIEELNELCRERTVAVMEVCGTHTVSLFRSGVKSMLPANFAMISGPGCPVCVTSQAYLDVACELAGRDDVVIATYGDMVRVPGSETSLEKLRGHGASVEVVYSARDALNLARNQADKQVVFLAVGFETTAPSTAAVVIEADARDVENFFILPGHKRVLPAMRALLSAGEVPIDGFLCPGHVSVVIGAKAYEPIAREFDRPCVVAGFEPTNMLRGLLHIARQVAAGEARVENVYTAAVHDEPNDNALGMIEKVFHPAPAMWRAMGELPDSGLELNEPFSRFDGYAHFGVALGEENTPAGCRCGEVIQGKITPRECPLFGKACSPLAPVGPCMVSSEGTCSAWYKYNRPA